LTEQKKSQKPPKPSVYCIVLCDTFSLDPNTGKYSLLGIFGLVWSRAFPVTHRYMTIFVEGTDAAGQYTFKIQIADLEEEVVIGEVAQEPITLADPVSTWAVVTAFENITFAKPGTYEIRVYANDEYLASRRLYVRELPMGGVVES